LFCGPCLVSFKLQRLNFTPQFFIFSHLALQEPPSQRSFSSHAGGGKQVGVGELVLVAAEVVRLDQSLVQQGSQTKICPDHPDVKHLGQGTLVVRGRGLEQAQDLQVGLVMKCFIGHASGEGIRTASINQKSNSEGPLNPSTGPGFAKDPHWTLGHGGVPFFEIT
jgi:hypothetical protein